MNNQGCGLGLVIANILSIGLSSIDNSNNLEKGLQIESKIGQGSKFSFIIMNKQ